MDILGGKKVLVLGMARSGIAAAKFLTSKGIDVTLADSKTYEQLAGEVKGLAEQGINLSFGHNPSSAEFDAVVVSPGVPVTVSTIVEAKSQGLPVISEVELAYLYSQTPMVAITGTNGKTTTTSMIGELVKNSGTKTAVVGNIGAPLISEISNFGSQDVLVVEVSSFQLETTKSFKPKVAVVLNITPDHLDRHGTLEAYTEAKAMVFANQDEHDFLILNYDDPIVRAMAKQAKSSVIFFSREHKLDKGIFAHDDVLYWQDQDQLTTICQRTDIKIPGPHNLENALAVGATAMALGIDVDVLRHTYRTFEGVAHRLEFVAEIDGVRYINDSKGTNPDAAMKALESFAQPIVLIAGGKNKGSKFDEFAQAMVGKVKALVVVGMAAEEIRSAAEQAGINVICTAKTFEEAVSEANAAAAAGDIVLLSPACASWDMFNSYEERGDLFKELVNSLRR